MGPQIFLSKMGRKEAICLPAPTVTLEEEGEVVSTSGKPPHILRWKASHVALLGLCETIKLKLWSFSFSFLISS